MSCYAPNMLLAHACLHMCFTPNMCLHMCLLAHVLALCFAPNTVHFGAKTA